MLNLVILLVIFAAGLFFTPAYSVLLGGLAIVINGRKTIRFFKLDVLILYYIVIVSIFYLQLINVNASKEILTYVIGPFLFYFLGKSTPKLRFLEKKIVVLLLFLLTAFSFYLFFKDYSGSFSLSLSDNYYYNSRNKLLIKSELDYSFMNETNLSLLVLTCVFLAIFVLKKRLFKIGYLTILISMLLILSSRSAVVTLVGILVFYFWKFKSTNFKFSSIIFWCVVLFVFAVNVNVLEIPYVNTFFKRFLTLSFESNNSLYGFDTRLAHYLTAMEHSNSLFDIKGYKFLLYRYEFSSHNEFLGHTSSVGILPALFFFYLLISLVVTAFNSLKETKRALMYKVLSAMVISYIMIGVTENVYIANVMWMYLFMFFIGLSILKYNDVK